MSNRNELILIKSNFLNLQDKYKGIPAEFLENLNKNY